jgi:hypothetical protein
VRLSAAALPLPFTVSGFTTHSRFESTLNDDR